MRNLLLAILLIVLGDYLLPSCANPQAPTGGPKDTIPPTLLETYPSIGTVNFKEQEITLVFDEHVKADRLQTTLIITPQQEVKFKTATRKNQLTLKFEEPFPDSTTVTLNFLEGVTDVTENNPAINLSYVFSTGSFLDSLSISGKVTHLMNGMFGEQITVGLYTLNDSLNLQGVKPTYFIKTDEEGRYLISNIKNGKYLILAFDDANSNLIFDGSEEAFGFKKDTLSLIENISNLNISLIKQNVSNLQKISARPSGKYYDIKYSKPLSKIITQPRFDYTFDIETNTLRFYKPEALVLGDSLLTYVTVIDSLSNQILDTLQVMFNESSRKSVPFNHTLKPRLNKIRPLVSYELSFTKPVKHFDSTLIQFVRDSTIQIPIHSDTDFQWNDNRTRLNFTYNFDTLQYFSSQRAIYDSAQSLIPQDTIIIAPTDTTKQIKIPPSGPKPFRIQRTITLSALKNTFISIENDTLDLILKDFSFQLKSGFGSMIVQLKGFDEHDRIQLITDKFKVIREYPFAPNIVMDQLEPGDYGIRILIDSNKDGTWSLGNFLGGVEPEEVYIYPDFTSLRANWEVSLNISK